jgi:hypothetical protein
VINRQMVWLWFGFLFFLHTYGVSVFGAVFFDIFNFFFDFS